MTKVLQCLVKVLDYEAQNNRKHKKVLKCMDCPLKKKCKTQKENNNKESEDHNYGRTEQHISAE